MPTARQVAHLLLPCLQQEHLGGLTHYSQSIWPEFTPLRKPPEATRTPLQDCGGHSS